MKILALGQVGYVFDAAGVRVVIDPYLSDAVAEQFGEDLRRQIPIVHPPAELAPVDWLLLTHAHLDHTDPATLRPLLAASPAARILAPFESRAILAAEAPGGSSVAPPPEAWIELAPGLELRAVPAAHTELERDAAGELRYVGFLLRADGVTIYHAGDTIPHEEIFAALAGERIDVAFLPVNERNFYRDRAGIVGNMTLREAFRFAADLGVKTLVPTHWDLFAPNSVPRGEIEWMHRQETPPFDLGIWPAGTVATVGND